MKENSEDLEAIRSNAIRLIAAAAGRVAASEAELALATAHRDQLISQASRFGVSRPAIGAAADLSVSRIEQILRGQMRGDSAFIPGDRVRIATSLKSTRTDRELKGSVGSFAQVLSVSGGRTIVEIVVDDASTNRGINDLDVGPTLALDDQLVRE